VGLFEGKQMKSAGECPELPFEQDAVYEPRAQAGDGSSNLDHFEALLAAAERASKAAARADCAAQGVPSLETILERDNAAR
jgi:hypothetical protein